MHRGTGKRKWLAYKRAPHLATRTAGHQDEASCQRWRQVQHLHTAAMSRESARRSHLGNNAGCHHVRLAQKKVQEFSDSSYQALQHYSAAEASKKLAFAMKKPRIGLMKYCPK